MRGNSWLFVRIGSSGGTVVFDRLLLQGEIVRFGLRKRLFISLGAPWNLNANIGRRSLTTTLPDSTANMVASRSGLTETTTTSRPTRSATTSPAGGPAPTAPIKETPAVEANTHGYRLMLDRDYTAALPLLRAAVAGLSNPTNPVTFYANFNLGQTLVQLGHCSSALPYLTRAAALQPTNRQANDALTYAHEC